MSADPGNEKPMADARPKPALQQPARKSTKQNAELWGAMRGTVIVQPGVDLTCPTGELWDADR